MILFIIFLSIAAQLTSAILAIRLIRQSHRSTAWILISIALLLMASRRVIIIAFIGSPNSEVWLNVLEIVGLAISLLMFFGMINIRSLFRKLNEFLEKQEELTDILEFTSDIVLTTDLSFNIIYMNKTAQRLLLNGKKVNTLNLGDLHPDYRFKEVKEEYIPFAIQNGIWKGENIVIKSDGSEIYVSQVIIYHRDADGNVYQYSTIARDITMRKEHENRLFELNKAKDRLFSVIAHDLRSPISSVKSAIETIVNEFDDFSKDELFELISSIKVSISNNCNLLDNLLQWSKMHIGDKPLHKANVNLRFAADSAIAFLASTAAEKSITIENNIPQDIGAFADANVLQLLFRNLLSNAIKFSHAGGKIIVGALAGEKAVEAWVQDFGVGIPEEKIADVLNIHEHYSSTGTANETGSGIGLSICRELIQSHSDATISCELIISSKENEGTTVSFNLPKEI